MLKLGFVQGCQVQKVKRISKRPKNEKRPNKSKIKAKFLYWANRLKMAT
jgi:hypothetical protein